MVNLKLVSCTEEYWEFVRLLRTNPANQEGFFTQAIITSEQQKEFMIHNWSKYKISKVYIWKKINPQTQIVKTIDYHRDISTQTIFQIYEKEEQNSKVIQNNNKHLFILYGLNRDPSKYQPKGK